ncbi:hypothetical protein HY642_02910 [Candidatus Woesearchaeota archaeon]|nr:hypothetical protein [Candidatus Woesearchaeota archaeon]
MPAGNVEAGDGRCIVKVQTRLFPMDVIYTAAYSLLDKAYVVLDGDPSDFVLVEIRSKAGTDHERLANLFNDQLLNYAVYKTQSERNAALRQIILQRALLSNGFDASSQATLEDKNAQH